MFGSSTLNNIVPEVAYAANNTVLDGGVWWFVSFVCGGLLAAGILSIILGWFKIDLDLSVDWDDLNDE
jgi:hypothetical protein